MLLSEEEQEIASSFYSPLCKSKPYLTPEQRKKIREKRKIDISFVADDDDTVKSNKKVRRFFPQKPKSKILGKKKKPKKVNKVGLPEVCCTAAEWVPQNKTNSENKKFFKTRSPEHLKKAKFVLQYKKSRLDFTEGKHSDSHDILQDIPSKSVVISPPKINTNAPAQSAISEIDKNVYISTKMTENPHIVKVSSIQNETAITEGKVINNSVLESNSKCVLSNEDNLVKGLELTHNAQETETRIVLDSAPSCSSANTMQENKLTSKPNYPIFYKENIKKMKWDTSPPPEKFLNESFRTKDKSKGCEQMIIDAGQSKIGAILCKTCGMIYTIGHEEDEKLHSENHHLYLQLKFPGWKDERVIGNYEDGRIIKILKDDKNFKLKKVQDVLLIVNRELGFPSAAFNGYLQGKDIVIILFISNDKFVKGCLVAESISSASPVVLDKKGSSNSYYASSETVRAICGINRIWVAGKYRKQKIASRMVDCLRSSFILGLVISVQELAFTDPTEDGMQFAASYTGTDNFLVYK